MAHHDKPFFERDQFRDFIAELCKDSDHVTFVAGAGLTIPEGRPTWRSLVWTLLYDRYQSRATKRSDSDAREFATALIKASDVISASTIASAGLSNTDLGKRIRTALYTDEAKREPGTMSTSQFARSLLGAAEVNWARGRDVMILTTNYDDSLIRSSEDHALAKLALRTISDEEQLVTYQDEKSADDAAPDTDKNEIRGQIPVVHLHGSIPDEGEFGGKIVLDERSYAEGGRELSWQAALFQDRLEKGPVIFIGMSMSDPNLTRYLLWSGTERSDRYVLMSQEDFQWHQSGSDITDSKTLEAFDNAMADRFDELGLSLLLVDHYRQVPQVLNEVALAVGMGDGYLDSERYYEFRLDKWLADMQWLADSGESEGWNEAQRVLAKELDSLRNDVADLLGVDKKSLRADLWLRTERHLVRVGSSEVVWTAPSSARRDRIDQDSPTLPAMRAFCNGVGLLDGDPRSRWKSSLSLPIVLSDIEEFDLLPVGVLDIRCTMPLDPADDDCSPSCLKELTISVMDEELASFLRRATQLATPTNLSKLMNDLS